MKSQQADWVFQEVVFFFLNPWIWHYVFTTETKNQNRRRQNLQSWGCFTALASTDWRWGRQTFSISCIDSEPGKNVICYMSPFVEGTGGIANQWLSSLADTTKLFSFPITFITASLILAKNSVVKCHGRNWITPPIAFHHSHPTSPHCAVCPHLPQCSGQ